MRWVRIVPVVFICLVLLFFDGCVGDDPTFGSSGPAYSVGFPLPYLFYEPGGVPELFVPQLLINLAICGALVFALLRFNIPAPFLHALYAVAIVWASLMFLHVVVIIGFTSDPPSETILLALLYPMILFARIFTGLLGTVLFPLIGFIAQFSPERANELTTLARISIVGGYLLALGVAYAVFGIRRARSSRKADPERTEELSESI